MIKHLPGATGFIMAGDMNVHHKRWLRWSNADTPVGTDLKVLCDNFGILQLVKEPTRGDYLLDLFLTDMACCAIQVLPKIADHKAILAKIPMPKVQQQKSSRYVWLLNKANWTGLEKDLQEIDWAPLKKGTSQDALNYFLEMLWYAFNRHIPYKAVEIKKQSHPWLNDRCENAITKKNILEGSKDFTAAQSSCNEVSAEEYQEYLGKLKSKIATLKKGSKQWWKLNRELLNKKTKITNIPPLRDGTTWLSDPKDKADLFAKTFSEKSTLPEEFVECPFFGHGDMHSNDFIAIRTRYTQKLFKDLNADTATGHDKLPAKILKKVGKFIAAPFTRICRRLLDEGCWPEVWRFHLIVPIFKKSSAFKAGNYRGVHLTPILSKIAEKVIGKRLIQHLRGGYFGENQWAFQPGLGARDLVTALIMSWILSICTGHKVGAYLSDISGAFDRVCKEYLLSN